MRKTVLVVFALAACATQNNIQTVKNFRAARERGDTAAAEAYLTPDSRIWFEKKDGPGEPFGHGDQPDRHWDVYFHARSTYSDWQSHGDSVSATVLETNDFYQLLDWKPAPYRLTYRFDAQGRIKEVLLESMGKSTSRLAEFKQWAAKTHPDELAYLMPNGHIDRTADRAERWHALLMEWRYGTKR
ncbi:MAG TPA: hypothetical protein VJ853_14765 [Thermoanaerobaculia bacterium]|nr:hypothetical protein [Thermoanaerobaculia bacterium]